MSSADAAEEQVLAFFFFSPFPFFSSKLLSVSGLLVTASNVDWLRGVEVGKYESIVV